MEAAKADFITVLRTVQGRNPDAHVLAVRGDCPADAVVFDAYGSAADISAKAKDCNSRLRRDWQDALFNGDGQFESVSVRAALYWLESPDIPWKFNDLREYGCCMSIVGPVARCVEIAYKWHVDAPLARA